MTTEEMLESARMISFVREISLAVLFKLTAGLEELEGLEGMNKSFPIANDGVIILGVDISKTLYVGDTQDDEVGDDRTTLDFLMVVECARKASLEKVMDKKQHEEKFKEDLIKIAMITLSPYKFVSQDKEHFAKLVVDAVMSLKGSTNVGSIQITKKPEGLLGDSFLKEGLLCEGALETGCEIASTFDSPESGVANGQPCTIVLTEARPRVLNEAERCMHNVLRTLSEIAHDIRVLFGGVWPELMSKAVDELARKTPGKEVTEI